MSGSYYATSNWVNPTTATIVPLSAGPPWPGWHWDKGKWVSGPFPRFYTALLTLVSCVIFLIRRNVLRIRRFLNPEMKGWPSKDANYILYMEIAFMVALLTMNGADSLLQKMGSEHYAQVGGFLISGMLTEP